MDGIGEGSPVRRFPLVAHSDRCRGLGSSMMAAGSLRSPAALLQGPAAVQSRALTFQWAISVASTAGDRRASISEIWRGG